MSTLDDCRLPMWPTKSDHRSATQMVHSQLSNAGILLVRGLTFMTVLYSHWKTWISRPAALRLKLEDVCHAWRLCSSLNHHLARPQPPATKSDISGTTVAFPWEELRVAALYIWYILTRGMRKRGAPGIFNRAVTSVWTWKIRSQQQTAVHHQNHLLLRCTCESPPGSRLSVPVPARPPWRPNKFDPPLIKSDLLGLIWVDMGWYGLISNN